MQLTKKTVREFLSRKKCDDIARYLQSGNRVIRLLISLSYDRDDYVSWRAIECIGFLSKIISDSNPEQVRELIRKLIWMIRDESGGIGWNSPEIIGEIVRNNPSLFSDIANIVVSFHDEEMLTAGVLRAIARIGKINEDFTDIALKVTLQYLHSPDKNIRGNALRAFGEIGSSEHIKKIEHLIHDKETIVIYENGELIEKTIGKITRKVITKLTA
jgi:hypothetical protein